MSKKITLTIPDKYARADIRVFLGRKLIHKIDKGIEYTAVSLCKECGECCRKLPLDWRFGTTTSGDCVYLADDGTCALGVDSPFMCCLGDGVNFPGRPEIECSVKWEKVD